LFGLLRITRAAITPGTHPQQVSRNTINKDPQPLSKTESGGKKIANKTLQKLIIYYIKIIKCFSNYPKFKII